MWEILQEIISYFIFLWVLYVVSYANLNANTFGFQQNMKNLFVSHSLKHDFTNVKTIR